jgi:integrase/recombinase XerC
MANRSVQLYLYADLPGIGWRYCRAVFGTNNKPKPHVLLRPDGIEEHHPEAAYYLGYRSDGHKVWENVGNSLPGTIRALEKKRTGQAYIAAGGALPGSETRVPDRRTNPSTAIEEWLEIIKEKFSGDSYGAKKLVLNEFLRSYGSRTKPKYIEDIQRVDALRFIITYLKEQGNGDGTRWNKFLHLRQFLSEYDHNVLKKGDAPKYGRHDPEVYTDEQVAAFFSKCDRQQFALFSVLYFCGLRLGEVRTLRWRDIKLTERFIHIDERPEYAWKPKKWHVRDIPIPPEFAADLLKLRENAKHSLVFHTRSGKPIYQMLEMCKRIAARAGIPREEAYLHKWRATYCVELLRQGVDLPSIQAAMGHKDLETTARHCAPLKKMALRERLDKVNSFNLKRNSLMSGNGAAAAS